MLKILQAAIIPVLLCANLLGDEYGVEKWPTPLGTELEWGMTSREAHAVMKKKGFKFQDKYEIKNRNPKFYPPSETKISFEYRGQFYLKSARVKLWFSLDDRLMKKLITFATTQPLRTGLKVAADASKQYGKPSKESFGKATPVGTPDKEITKDAALREQSGDVNFTIDWLNTRTEKVKFERPYLTLWYDKDREYKGLVTLSACGPTHFERMVHYYKPNKVTSGGNKVTSGSNKVTSGGNVVETIKDGKIYRGNTTSYRYLVGTYKDSKIYKGNTTSYTNLVGTIKDGKIYRGNSVSYTNLVGTYTGGEYSGAAGAYMLLLRK